MRGNPGGGIQFRGPKGRNEDLLVRQNEAYNDKLVFEVTVRYSTINVEQVIQTARRAYRVA